MIIRNNTHYDLELQIKNAVKNFPVDGLEVEIKYCPKNSRRYISGSYYRRCKNYEHGKFIRLRINKHNKYPIEVGFKTSEYTKKVDRKGRVTIYQNVKKTTFANAEDLTLAIFLHEFSHYLDHVQGLNGNYKQTKADKFATSMLENMGVI